MRIVWATPFNGRSAIARFSAHVVDALVARGHELTVLRTEVGEAAAWAPIDESAVIVAPGSPAARQAISKADVVAVNFGDYWNYHAAALDLPSASPKVGIFHDWCFISLFNGWLHYGEQGTLPRDTMMRLYGTSAWELYRSSPPDELLTNATQYFPMTEWLAQCVDAAITHSAFYQPRVRTACAGPVVHIPLAYPGHPFRGMRNDRPDDKLVLYTFGMINPNKRVESVIRTLGDDAALRSSIAYHVDGAIASDYRDYLQDLAAQLGVDVEFRGTVTEEQLQAGLESADAICCLRYPAVEGASASAIEAMQAAKPVIVTDTAFYAELPDRYVLKVDAEDEGGSLRRRLHEVLAMSPDVRGQFGESAALWARQEFSAENYARRAESFFRQVCSERAYIETCTRLAADLAVLQLGSNDPLVGRIASTLDALKAGAAHLPPAAYDFDSKELQ